MNLLLKKATIVCLTVALSLCGCGKSKETEEIKMPKKYFTMSFDDGTYEDEKMIELLRKYNISASFCINSGLTDGNDVIEVLGNWRRMSGNYMKENNVYDGFDVISHGYEHRELISLTDEEIVRQIKSDIDGIKELTGLQTVGFAYPGGTAYYNDLVIQTILEQTPVRYSRDTDDTYGFRLPNNFMAWKPTCSLLDDRLMELAEQFVEADCTEDMLFYAWDHPWAISGSYAWKKVENFFAFIADREDIVYVSNSEFYELFKDKIPSETVW